MEKLTPELKKELLKGLSELEIKYSEFEHNLEDVNITYDKIVKYFETENLNVTIELEEGVSWSDIDFYETTNLNVSDLKVSCENGEVDVDFISNEELLNHINY